MRKANLKIYCGDGGGGVFDFLLRGGVYIPSSLSPNFDNARPSTATAAKGDEAHRPGGPRSGRLPQSFAKSTAAAAMTQPSSAFAITSFWISVVPS